MHKITAIDVQEGTKQAWHGLTKIRKNLTLEKNWLREWDIEPKPLFDENQQEVGFSLLGVTDNEEVRIGTPFNPKTYRPFSNDMFLELIHDAIAGTKHKVETIGSVRGRGRVFASIKLEGLDQFDAAGRKFDPYLNFGNGHDKSSVLWVSTSNTCTVCDNTFTFNKLYQKEAAAINIKLRHTAKAEDRFPEIADMIDKAVGVQQIFQKNIQKMGEKKVKPLDAKKWMTGFILRKESDKLTTQRIKRVDRLEELFENGKGNKGENRSDLFSAITDFYTHEYVEKSDISNRIYQSEFGRGANRKSEAYCKLTNEGEYKETVARGAAALN